MFGFLNIYKPQGKTSHDVVAILRRITKIKQIGHTGTLDPFAEGVLPICIGKATRLIEYLDDDKAYIGTVQLGKSTTTYDTEGDVVNISNKKVTLKDVEEVLPKFMDFVEGLPLVAHNVDFDYGFLCENYNRVYNKEFRRKRSCTMKMYRKWYKEQYDENAPCAKLGDLVLELLGNEEYLSYSSNSHRGLNDAEFTQKVYEKLI